MDARLTWLATLRRLLPDVRIRPPVDAPKRLADLELGAVLGMGLRDGMLVLMVAEGMELRVRYDAEAWRTLGAAMQSGDLSFDDPNYALRRVAELLGTQCEHLDA